jgi:hypothetical protein
MYMYYSPPSFFQIPPLHCLAGPTLPLLLSLAGPSAAILGSLCYLLAAAVSVATAARFWLAINRWVQRDPIFRDWLKFGAAAVTAARSATESRPKGFAAGLALSLGALLLMHGHLGYTAAMVTLVFLIPALMAGLLLFDEVQLTSLAAGLMLGLLGFGASRALLGASLLAWVVAAGAAALAMRRSPAFSGVVAVGGWVGWLAAPLLHLLKIPAQVLLGWLITRGGGGGGRRRGATHLSRRFIYRSPPFCHGICVCVCTCIFKSA